MAEEVENAIRQNAQGPEGLPAAMKRGGDPGRPREGRRSADAADTPEARQTSGNVVRCHFFAVTQAR